MAVAVLEPKTKKVAKSTGKIVQVLARTAGSHWGQTYYTVLSSNGKDTYITEFQCGKFVRCSCPSRVDCYHGNNLAAYELEQFENMRSAYEMSLPAVNLGYM